MRGCSCCSVHSIYILPEGKKVMKADELINDLYHWFAECSPETSSSQGITSRGSRLQTSVSF